MITNRKDILIDFRGTPNRPLLLSFAAYAVLSLAGIAILAVKVSCLSKIELYFYTNYATSAIVAWFLSKSLRTQTYGRYIIFFRCGLFIIFNCTLLRLFSGLALINPQYTVIIISLLFIPAISLIIVSFNGFVSFVNDHYKSAINLSLTDELTRLPNRRAMNIALENMVGQEGIICIIDIDHFKYVNDSYGHETGDNILVAVGLALTEFINNNVYVFRSGGEEFCILIKGDDNAKALITQIKKALTITYNREISITISAGVSLKNNNESPTSVMAKADDALYKAKRAGRNCIVYADDGFIEY